MIQIDSAYYIDKDSETIGIKFYFCKTYPANLIGKMRFDESCRDRAIKITTSSTETDIIKLKNKETLVIEIWLDDAVIAGGLYQIDTKHEEREDFVLRSICSYGVELSQDNILADIIDHEYEQYQEIQQDILKVILSHLDANNIPYEMKNGGLQVYYPTEE